MPVAEWLSPEYNAWRVMEREICCPNGGGGITVGFLHFPTVIVEVAWWLAFLLHYCHGRGSMIVSLSALL